MWPAFPRWPLQSAWHGLIGYYPDNYTSTWRAPIRPSRVGAVASTSPHRRAAVYKFHLRFRLPLPRRGYQRRVPVQLSSGIGTAHFNAIHHSYGPSFGRSEIILSNFPPPKVLPSYRPPVMETRSLSLDRNHFCRCGEGHRASLQNIL